MNKIKIDIVIPVYIEAENIEAIGNGLYLVLMLNGQWFGIKSRAES